MSEHQSFQGISFTSNGEKIVNFAQNVEGVAPKNMLNYDETNLSDDPGRKKVIMKKETRYSKCIMSHSKSTISIMCAIVQMEIYYCHMSSISLHICMNLWTIEGPVDARYNWSFSGWFKMLTFED